MPAAQWYAVPGQQRPPSCTGVGGALVLAGYAAVMAGVGSWLTVRRDIT